MVRKRRLSYLDENIVNGGANDDSDEEVIEPHYKHFWNDISVQLARQGALRRRVALSGHKATEYRRHNASKQLRAQHLINPEGRYKALWDAGIIVLIVYTVVSLPYVLAFNVGFDAEFFVMESILTALFLCDILITFNTASRDPITEVYITDRRQLAANYMRLWLWVDLAATIPVDQLVSAALPALDTQSLKLLRLMRFFRIFKLLKMQRIYSLSSLQSTALVFAVILFLCHILGCFWFMLGSSETTDAYASGIPGSWVQLAEENGYADSSYAAGDYYVLSFYWAATTMLTIGYGDVHAVNNQERLYCILTMLVGSITLGSLVDQVVKFITSLNLEAKANKERLSEFTLYLQESGRVPTDIKQRALAAFAYYLKQKSSWLEQADFRGMPPAVLSKLVANLYGATIKKVRLFQTMLQLEEKHFIIQLILSSKPFQAAAGDVVCGAGDMAVDVVFVLAGEVCLWTREGSQRITNGYATHGDYFGDLEYYSQSTRIASYCAVTDCRLLSIRAQDIAAMSLRFEEAGAFFRRACRMRYKAYMSVLSAGLAGAAAAPVAAVGMSRREAHQQLLRDASGHLVRARVWVNGEVVAYEAAARGMRAGSQQDARDDLLHHVVVGVGERGKLEFSDLSSREMLALCHMLHPSLGAKVAWDILVALLVLYCMLVVPVEVAFQRASSGGWFAVDLLVNALFLLDCCLTFRTAYLDEEMQAHVLVPGLVAHRYLRGWFAVDLLSSLPWDAITSGGLGDLVAGNSTAFKIFNVLRLLKLFRIARLGRYFSALEEWFTLSPTVLELFKLFFQIFAICHFVACIWWGLSVSADGASWIDNPGQVYADTLRSSSLQSQYVTSLYWAFTTLTTTGYGDITPLSTENRVLTVVLEILGSAVFGYILASVGVIFEHSAPADARRNAKLSGAHAYLKENGVPGAVSELVLRHLRLKFDQASIFDENDMLARLPTRLSDDLYVLNRLSKLKHIPIFDYITNRSLAVHIYRLLEVSFHDKSEYVFREGEQVNAIKFLVSGACVAFRRKRGGAGKAADFLSQFAAVMLQKPQAGGRGGPGGSFSKSKARIRKRSYDPAELQVDNAMPDSALIDVIGSLRPGNFFGHLSMLRQSRYPYSIWTTEEVCVYSLRKSDITAILLQYHDVAFALKTSLIEAISRQRVLLRKQLAREKRFQFLKQLNFDSKCARRKLLRSKSTKQGPVTQTLLRLSKSVKVRVLPGGADQEDEEDDDTLDFAELSADVKARVRRIARKWRRYKRLSATQPHLEQAEPQSSSIRARLAHGLQASVSGVRQIVSARSSRVRPVPGDAEDALDERAGSGGGSEEVDLLRTDGDKDSQRPNGNGTLREEKTSTDVFGGGRQRSGRRPAVSFKYEVTMQPRNYSVKKLDGSPAQLTLLGQLRELVGAEEGAAEDDAASGELRPRPQENAVLAKAKSVLFRPVPPPVVETRQYAGGRVVTRRALGAETLLDDDDICDYDSDDERGAGPQLPLSVPVPLPLPSVPLRRGDSAPNLAYMDTAAARTLEAAAARKRSSSFPRYC